MEQTSALGIGGHRDGWIMHPDGAGPIGPDQYPPQPSVATDAELRHSLNPLQHLPGVGMIYRAATGEAIPPAMRILGAAAFGGPVGVLGAIFGCLIEELVTLGPDHSRPPVPAGFTETGSEAGPSPVTPGTQEPGSYLTLATVQPDFLRSPLQMQDPAQNPFQDVNTAVASAGGNPIRGPAAYQATETEWQRTTRMERGLA